MSNEINLGVGMNTWWERRTFSWHLFVVLLQVSSCATAPWGDVANSGTAFGWWLGLVVLVSVCSPIVGFVMAALHGHGGIPEGEAPRQSGGGLGLGWFEFESRPGQTFLVRDPTTVANIRSRPGGWVSDGVYGWSLPDRVHPLPVGILASQQNAYNMALATLGWLPFLLAFGGVTAIQRGELGRLFAPLLLWAIWVVVALTITAVVYGLSTIVAVGAANLLVWVQHSQHVVVEGEWVRADGRTFHLGIAGRESALRWGPTGAVLHLRNERESLLVRGSHEHMVDLKRCVDAHRLGDSETREGAVLRRWVRTVER